MKKILLLFFLLNLVGFTACEQPAEPEFKTVKNLRVGKLAFDRITILGNAEFHNPNPQGIKLTATDLDVFVDDKKVGKVEQTHEIQVPAAQDFMVPIEFSFATKDVFGKMLGGALSFLGNKKVKVHLKGKATVKVVGISIPVPVDHTEEMSLKK